MFPGFERLSSKVLDRVKRASIKAMKKGLDADEVTRLAVEEFSQSLADSTPKAVRYFDEVHTRVARKLRRENRAFENRLHDRWNTPLDRYLAIVFLGVEFLNHIRDEADDDELDDVVRAVLTDIAARACRIANAIHHLLSGGFALDALARARSVHELAVAAYILGEEATPEEQRDIAERFLLHAEVGRYKDALVYQANAARLGQVPFSDEDIAVLRTRRDDLVQKYGASYKNDNGWAAKRLGKERPTFADLELRAQLSHLRGYYKWATHEVHSGPRSLEFNAVEFRGVNTRIVNRSNHHLADPAQIALIALGQCVTVVLGHVAKEPTGLLYLQAMTRHIEIACEEFVSVQAQIEREEEEVERLHGGGDTPNL
jgi:hypothetical protein